jgi:hypothetical protein
MRVAGLTAISSGDGMLNCWGTDFSPRLPSFDVEVVPYSLPYRIPKGWRGRVGGEHGVNAAPPLKTRRWTVAVLLEREGAQAPTPWRATTFFATTADARTQIGACWQAAAELAQVDPGLTGNGHRLRLLESLRRLLDALAYLDVAVPTPNANHHDERQARRCRRRYAEAYAHLQRAALATDDLVGDIGQGPLFQPNTRVLRQAMARLRRHLDDLGRVVTGPGAQIA